jgi:alpha-D-ribose 1-methylphosphonate 5-triphosphate synthase subunit PhnG
MLMMRLRDPVANEVFNVGEILVTQARVEIDDVYGYAVRLGDHPVVALAAAVLDAAAEVGHGLAPRILALLGDIEANERLRRGEAWRSVTPTRVSFDEMG